MMRRGSYVFAALIGLDVVEYIVAINAKHVLVWMTLLAMPQVWLIARFFMHYPQLRRGGEH
jgi:hypothetical protein